MLKDLRSQLFWFVPLGITSALFALAPGLATLAILSIRGMLATTPFRAGRLSALQVFLSALSAMPFGTALGITIKLIFNK